MTTPQQESNAQFAAQTFSTPDEIAYFRFCQLKYALKVEALGLKHKGGALRPKLATEFGLKPRDPLTAYIAYCETQQALLLAKRTFATTRPLKDIE